MEPIVILNGVGKDYQQGRAVVHALRDIDFEVGQGEFVAVAGPSGSGKTTLLNLMSGLDKPTSGDITVDGRKLGELNRSDLARLRLQRVGFVFQAFNLLPVLTALENAEYVLLLQGVPAKARRKRVSTLFERVGLRGLEHRFPRELSGGQQQRVAIARAIAAEPALVMADEPTANLDSATAAELMQLMFELNDELGTTFVFSTHDRSVMRRARRLVQLKDGAIVQDGPPEALSVRETG